MKNNTNPKYNGSSNLLRIDDVPGEPAFGHFPFASTGQAVRQGVHLQQTPATGLPSVVGVQDMACQAFAEDQGKIRCVLVHNKFNIFLN